MRLPHEVRLLLSRPPPRPILLSRWYSISRPFSVELPSYPGLYLHSLPSSASPLAFALSFLPEPSPAPTEYSPSTIGFLRRTNTTSSAGGEDAQGYEVTPDNFIENTDFKELLADVLLDQVASDEVVSAMAQTRVEGYMHVADARSEVDANRVPDPSDILATVYVKEGKVVPDTVEVGQTHRLVTRDGMFKLPPEGGMDRRLREIVKGCWDVEKELYG